MRIVFAVASLAAANIVKGVILDRDNNLSGLELLAQAQSHIQHDLKAVSDALAQSSADAKTRSHARTTIPAEPEAVVNAQGIASNLARHSHWDKHLQRLFHPNECNQAQLDNHSDLQVGSVRKSKSTDCTENAIWSAQVGSKSEGEAQTQTIN